VDEAMIRGLAVRNMNARLQDLQGQMFVWLEQSELRVLETLEGRAFFKVLDAMVRLSVQRCRLHGMFVHPWRYDQWYREDVPLRSWWDLHRLSAELERQAAHPAAVPVADGRWGSGAGGAAAPSARPGPRYGIPRPGQRASPARRDGVTTGREKTPRRVTVRWELLFLGRVHAACEFASPVVNTSGVIRNRAAIRAEVEPWNLGDVDVDPSQTLLMLISQSPARVELYSAAVPRLARSHRRVLPQAGGGVERYSGALPCCRARVHLRRLLGTDVQGQ
jgi:hypothetical protein